MAAPRMMKLPNRRPSQAEVVGVFLGTVDLLRGEGLTVSDETLVQAASRLVPLMDLSQPTWQVLHDRDLTQQDIDRLRSEGGL